MIIFHVSGYPEVVSLFCFSYWTDCFISSSALLCCSVRCCVCFGNPLKTKWFHLLIMFGILITNIIHNVDILTVFSLSAHNIYFSFILLLVISFCSFRRYCFSHVSLLFIFAFILQYTPITTCLWYEESTAACSVIKIYEWTLCYSHGESAVV